MEIKLTGPSALVGLAGLAVFAAYRISTMQAELETEALEELKGYLAAEYTGDDVAALSRALESSSLSAEEASQTAERVLAAHDITFPSATARGKWKGLDGEEVIVKVEIEVAGGPPPDGEPVRYYRMRYRSLSGWKVGARTSAWAYRLKLF